MTDALVGFIAVGKIAKPILLTTFVNYCYLCSIRERLQARVEQTKQ
jgi:hypothetical protein